MIRSLILSCLVFGCALVATGSAEPLTFDQSPFAPTDTHVVPPLSVAAMRRLNELSSLNSSPHRNRQPIVRGQSPSTFDAPTLTVPSDSQFTPYSGANAFTTQDPFIYGPDPVLGGSPLPVLSGVNGPQPYRMGFTPAFDYTFLAGASADSPASGRFESQGFNFDLAYTTPVGPGWMLTSTPQFGVEWWEGPGTIPLPANVFRMGWDLTLASPQAGPWSFVGSFNPSINTDFENSLSSEAWNIDGNAMLLYRLSPQYMFVLGAGYWDRVDSIILPYVGLVANPTDRWEFRLLFPKARITYFLGQFGDAANWLYFSGEYHVEAYQIGMPGGGREQVQLADWRLALGLRSDHGWYDKFVEFGYVLGRNVEFKNGTPGFDLSDTFMFRAGVKF